MADDKHNLDVTSSDIYAGTSSLTTNGAAIGSSINDLCELILQADPGNAVNILIGSSTAQTWVMEPGDTFNCPVRNPSKIYAKSASSTATINYVGRKGT